MSGLLKLPSYVCKKKTWNWENYFFNSNIISWSYSIQPDICDSYHPILHFWHVHKMSWWESRERLQNHSVCKICSVLLVHSICSLLGWKMTHNLSMPSLIISYLIHILLDLFYLVRSKEPKRHHKGEVEMVL